MEITIPSNIVSDLMTANATTFASLLPIYGLMVSIPVSFYILRKIIMLFPKR